MLTTAVLFLLGALIQAVAFWLLRGKILQQETVLLSAMQHLQLKLQASSVGEWGRLCPKCTARIGLGVTPCPFCGQKVSNG